jgi:hypothetical protein
MNENAELDELIDRHFASAADQVGMSCDECGAAVLTAMAATRHIRWHEALERRFSDGSQA